MKRIARRCTRQESGYSLSEIVIVLTIMAVLTAISLPYLYQYKKLYKSEDQSLKVMYMMREAGQLALTRRRPMRLEIDLTANAVVLIDENGVGAADDTQIKSIPLEPVNEVRMDVIPAGVVRPNPPNYNNAAFAADAIGHRVGAATVVGNMVWAARFQSDGSVRNAAGLLPVSSTLYVWPPVTPGSTTPRQKTEIRAITMFGGSGAVRYWKHDGTTFLPY